MIFYTNLELSQISNWWNKKNKWKYWGIIVQHNKTILIIFADHGHLIGDKIKLNYYEVNNYLLNKKVYIENRFPNFVIQPEFKKEFIQVFNKDLCKDFFSLPK